jgi:hypothetical protein
VRIALALVIGCSAPSPMPPPSVTRVTFEGAARPLARTTVDPREADCARCHEAIAREHDRSLHAQAYTNPIFAAAYAEETLPSCVHCHAPRGDLARGVDCESCHVRDGFVIGAYRRERSPHPGPIDPSMNESEFCAGCHQFDFPDDVDLGLSPSGVPMQDTFGEWTRSESADRAHCQDCHMRDREGRVAHGVSVRRDPSVIMSALRFDARREDGAIVVTIAARNVGHAVPTGDLFRTLIVRATAGDQVFEHRFARTFRGELREGRVVRRDDLDDRIPEPGFDIERTLRFDIAEPARLEVIYELLPAEVAERQHVDGWRIPLHSQQL